MLTDALHRITMQCMPKNGDLGKKSESLPTIRVEKDVYDFYVEEARRRRVSIAMVVRELLYEHMEAEKGTTNDKV